MRSDRWGTKDWMRMQFKVNDYKAFSRRRLDVTNMVKDHSPNFSRLVWEHTLKGMYSDNVKNGNFSNTSN
jgi:hypothetical protein